MNIKEQVKNQILWSMNNCISPDVSNILEAVLIKTFNNIEITEIETAPATIDNTNQYILDLFQMKKGTKLSTKTVEAYMETIKNFIAQSGRNLLKVSTNDIEYFLYLKQLEGASNVTLNNYLRNISAFYSWMRKNALVVVNPCDSIEKYPVENSQVECLDTLDMDMVRMACSTKRQRAIVELLRSTALRRSEVASIKVGDIDFGSGKITVYGRKTRTYRDVYIDPLCKHYLQLYLGDRITDKESQLFTAVSANRDFTGRDVYEIIRRLAKKTKIKKLHPHIFRATTATSILRRGGTEDMAGFYLGHSPKSVTGKYYIKHGAEYTKDIFEHYIEAV